MKSSIKDLSSVPCLCLDAVLRHGKADALSHREDGKWINVPAEDFVERVKNTTLGLAALVILS